jgi:hypothetical protein
MGALRCTGFFYTLEKFNGGKRGKRKNPKKQKKKKAKKHHTS